MKANCWASAGVCTLLCAVLVCLVLFHFFISFPPETNCLRLNVLAVILCRIITQHYTELEH